MTDDAHGHYEVSAAEALTQCLLHESVDRVFGIPGSYMLALLDAFDRAGIRSIEARHEGAASFMAAGYAMARGTPAVVHTSSGPGTTNALTGVTAAYMDLVPLLVLCSQVPSPYWGRNGHQESTGLNRTLDQLAIFRDVSSMRGRPTSGDHLVRLVRTALRHVSSRRGVAVVECPIDVLFQRIKFHDLPPARYRAESRPVDRAGVERLAAMLAGARQPLLVIGDQLAHRGMAPTVVELCEKLELPCASLNSTKGIVPEDHPLSVGVLGRHGHDTALEYLRTADLTIAVGVRMGPYNTYRFNDSLFRHLVQIDEDETEIGGALPVELGLFGDLAATMRALRDAASAPATPRRSAERVAELRHRLRVYREPETPARDGLLSPDRVLFELRRALPRDTLVVGDTGTTYTALSRQFPVYAEDGLFSLHGLAAMGSGMPLAHGVQLARPDATVLSVMGDGAFMVHLGELAVAAQHRLPVIHVVMNNGLYKSVSQRQQVIYGRIYGTEIRSGDNPAIARAFGCAGYQVRSVAELHDSVTRALAAREPCVIDVAIDPELGEPMEPTEVDNLRRLVPEPPQGWPMPRPGPSKP